MPVSTMDRIVVRMDGFPGAPGYMTFYCDDAISGQPAVITFLNAVKAFFPTIVKFTVPNEGDIIWDSDGTLTGTWSGGTETAINGTGAGSYPAPSGAVISWQTGAIVGSRRLRGRTFLVPLVASAFDTDGSISSAPLATMRTAASALWVAASLRVWHRPTSTGAGNGSSAPVNGSAVADRAAVLTSRRA